MNQPRRLADYEELNHYPRRRMGGIAMEDGSGASLVGQTLCGRWRVLRRLGRGGTSTVYEGQEPDHRPVAIKVLDAALANNPRARVRFLREAGLTEIIGHPDAVRVFEHCVTPEGLPLLVMERLEGETLRERCERAPMDVAEVVDASCRVLEVLAIAHGKGIVHRDIKPENVFLTDAGDVKVLDFGIAAVRDEAGRDSRLTQSGASLGTPAFMAPEQARGRHAGMDGRTDVWAVGATMFYCLAGRRVHEEAVTANEALIFVATQKAPSLAKFRPDVPLFVTRTIDRALALSPDARWPSAAAMRDALLHPASREASLSDARSEPLLDETGDPFSAPVVRPPAGPRAKPARGRVVAVAATCVAGVCAVLLATGVVPRGRSLPGPPPVLTPSIRPIAPAELAPLAPSVTAARVVPSALFRAPAALGPLVPLASSGAPLRAKSASGVFSAASVAPPASRRAPVAPPAAPAEDWLVNPIFDRRK
jgi:serine/threonine-protein kinase